MCAMDMRKCATSPIQSRPTSSYVDVRTIHAVINARHAAQVLYKKSGDKTLKIRSFSVNVINNLNMK